MYLVTSYEKRNILYIYRCDQRTPAEILAEWKFVDFLYTNGIPVAPAVPNKNGELLMTFDAPEGTRHGVLAPFVDGKHLRQRPNIGAVRTYGRIVAQIHALANTMPFDLDRPINDWETLINQSVAAFDSVITVNPEDKAYLHQAAATLHPKMATLPREKPLYGMIHGDVIRANAQVSDDGQVTVLDFDLCGLGLDFDLCGLGWRSYDVASYLQVLKGLPDQDESERAFLGGYQEIRSLTTFEQEALPLFEAVRTIFDIGVKSANVYHWGSAYLNTFLGQSMEQLRQCMKSVG
ncbi:MAG: phosphotransferase [Chloroflexi bacterium]|nr:phosphotransferase [Chloroflexota bacterium]